MKITYTLTFWELARSGMLTIRLIMPRLYVPVYVFLVIALIGVPVGSVWTIIDFWREGIPLKPFLPILVAQPIGILLFAGIFYVMSMIAARRQTVTFDNEAISLRYFGYRNQTPWKSVDSVEEDERYIYISAKPPRVPFLSVKITRGRWFFGMIPKHVFPTSAEAETFLNQAMNYWHPAANDTPQNKGSWPPAPIARS